MHEYILVLCKDTYRRPKVAGRESTIARQDFLDWTRSVWQFPTESARRIGHPAPFPVELPRRCIDLYAYAGEVVLDPLSWAAVPRPSLPSKPDADLSATKPPRNTVS